MRLSEADLKVNPNDPRLAASLAVHLQKAGEPGQAHARIQDALVRAPKDVEVLYRAAVIRALAGQVEQAMTFLEKAVAGGYSRSRVNEDDDLAGLRKFVAYQVMLSSQTP